MTFTSEVELRDGTVVRHFVSMEGRQRDVWEVEYPDGEKLAVRGEKPLDWRESARLLEERWPDEFGEGSS